MEISGEDFREGLIAVISVKVAEPQFEGQTKTKLGNNEVSGAVNQAVGEALTYYLEEHPNVSRHARPANPYSARARGAEADFPENWQTAQAAIRKNANSSLSRETQQADQPNKDAAVSSRPSCPCAVKS